MAPTRTQPLWRAVCVFRRYCADDIDLHFFSDRQLAVDGYTGVVYIDPPPQVLSQFHQLAEEEQELKDIVSEHSHLPKLKTVSELATSKPKLDVAHDYLQSLNIDGVGHRSEIPRCETSYHRRRANGNVSGGA